MRIGNIKFKAKRLDNGEWVEGTPICINGKPYGIMIGEKESPDIDPSTVCQFTGLTDCQGNEVWEGDIIKNPYLGNIATVEWSDSLCGFKCVDNAGYINYSLKSVIKSFDWYVVGNKYNKERMNYKKVLTRYIQGRLSELSNVDAYEPNKLALTNMLWFLDKVTSNEVIVAKLKIMDGADIKRKKYLSRYDGNESLYDDDYFKAVGTIGKDCLSYLQNAKNEVQDENKASQ